MNTYPETEIEYDEEGFVTSFTIDQKNDFVQYFVKYGFVVINDVITEEQIQLSIQDIWNEILTIYPDIDKNDPRTWEKMNIKSGILGNNYCKTKQCFINRFNPKIHDIFSTILERNDLWVSIDRVGFMRPTKNIPMNKLIENEFRILVDSENNATVDKPEWKTSLSLHLDLNPYKFLGIPIKEKSNKKYDYEIINFLSENNGGPSQLVSKQRNGEKYRLQGLLNFVTSDNDTGGFETVPGFQKHLENWAAEAESLLNLGTKFSWSDNYIVIPPEDPLTLQTKKITARKGSFILWDSRLPHRNFENDSHKFRMVQYIKMFLNKENYNSEFIERKSLIEEENILPNDLILTQDQEKLMGLRSYYENTCK